MLSQFISAQYEYHDIVKRELLNGEKESHWMWFTFPQLDGLGFSVNSKKYGIKNLEEARDYWAEPYLRKNMTELISIILMYKDGTDIEDVFGPLDSVKLKSSMTLFYLATHDDLFEKVLNKFYNGCFDEQTVLLLN